MSYERCQHCGRTLEQPEARMQPWRKVFKCIRCMDSTGEEKEVIHAKLVRLAWKYRSITRRMCYNCKWSQSNTRSLVGGYVKVTIQQQYRTEKGIKDSICRTHYADSDTLQYIGWLESMCERRCDKCKWWSEKQDGCTMRGYRLQCLPDAQCPRWEAK